MAKKKSFKKENENIKIKEMNSGEINNISGSAENYFY